MTSSMDQEFITHPVTVRAFKMTLDRINNNEHWPFWMHQRWQEVAISYGSIWPAMVPNGTPNELERCLFMTVADCPVLTVKLIDPDCWVVMLLNGDEEVFDVMSDEDFTAKYIPVDNEPIAKKG